MVGSGVSSFIEVGPGKVLSGMVKRIDRRANITSIDDFDSILSLHRN